VDRLERDLEGQLQVLRFSVGNRVGRQLASRYGVPGVPTFILFDGSGNIVHSQIGRLDADAVKAELAGLQ
jgi:thioredoxin-related protein